MRLMLKVGITTCCLLLVGFACLIGTTASIPTTVSPDLPTSAASTKNENVTDSAESQKDLDLETQDQVAILKQINRVNEDGSYTFGYEAADGSFKIETRDVAGNVKGMFGFIDETGELKRVSYSASNGTGFQSTGDLNIPPLPGTIPTTEEEVTGNYKKTPTRVYQQIVRPRDYVHEKIDETSTSINLLDVTTPQTDYSSTTLLPTTSSPKLPIYIFGTTATPRYEPEPTARPLVIQHIPKLRPTPGSTTTDPTEATVIITRKPTYNNDFTPRRSNVPSYISLSTSTSTTTSTTEQPSRNDDITQAITRRPTTARTRPTALRRIVVTRKPIETTTQKLISTTALPLLHEKQHLTEKTTFYNSDRSSLRKQSQSLNQIPVTPKGFALDTSGSEDSPDVYGATPVARPFPTTAFRGFYNQLPQHQRILQNSFIQNQNQYLAAGYGARLPPVGVLPQDNLVPADPPPPTRENPQPIPNDPQIGRPIPQPPVPAPPIYRGYQDGPQIPPQYRGYEGPIPNPNYNPQQQQNYNPQAGPPGLNPVLMQQLIQMFLAAQQQRQQQQSGLSPFQQALLSTLGPENIPPELVDRRQYAQQQQPQQQMPYPNDPRYDPRYNQYDPRYAPQPYMSRQPYPYAPPPPVYNPAPYYNPYQGYQGYQGYPQPQFGYGPYPQYYQRPQYQPYPAPIPDEFREMLLFRMLLGARLPQPGTLTPQIQNSPNPPRSPSSARGDSAASATTTIRPFATRTEQPIVRNVQIIESGESDSTVPYGRVRSK